MAASAFAGRNSFPAADPTAATAAMAAASLCWPSRASIASRRSAQRKHWRATHGAPGTGSDCHGRNGEDLVLRVPPGTVVYDADGGFLLKDLAQPGESVVAARGGRGGRGNVAFQVGHQPRSARSIRPAATAKSAICGWS